MAPSHSIPCEGRVARPKRFTSAPAPPPTTRRRTCSTVPPPLTAPCTHVLAHPTNTSQRLYRLYPASAIPSRDIQQHRPILRQPRRRNMEFSRNKCRHHLLLPPPPAPANGQMPPRRLLLAPTQHTQHASHLPDHRERTLSTAAQPQRRLPARDHDEGVGRWIEGK